MHPPRGRPRVGASLMPRPTTRPATLRGLGEAPTHPMCGKVKCARSGGSRAKPVCYRATRREQAVSGAGRTCACCREGRLIHQPRVLSARHAGKPGHEVRADGASFWVPRLVMRASPVGGAPRSWGSWFIGSREPVSCRNLLGLVLLGKRMNLHVVSWC